MSERESRTGGGVHITLEIWHPDCWTLEVTAGRSAGLLAHTVYNATDGLIRGHFTAYGDEMSAVDELIAATRESTLTETVTVMQRRHGVESLGVSGTAARELFVEYDPANTISDALASRGFIQESPVRIFDGREHWSVFVSDPDRDRLRDQLDALRASESAEIEVTRITTNGGNGERVGRIHLLSARQREVFRLAAAEGYYSWPRETTTRELAAQAGCSKTTLLEHLRKAEAKLLEPAVDNLSGSS